MADPTINVAHRATAPLFAPRGVTADMHAVRGRRSTDLDRATVRAVTS